MLAEEAKACFSPWSTCWLHSSLEFEKSLKNNGTTKIQHFLVACMRWVQKISAAFVAQRKVEYDLSGFPVPTSS